MEKYKVILQHYIPNSDTILLEITREFITEKEAVDFANKWNTLLYWHYKPINRTLQRFPFFPEAARHRKAYRNEKRKYLGYDRVSSVKLIKADYKRLFNEDGTN